MKKIVLTAGLLAMSFGMAHADPIADRQALMKDMGKAVGSVAKIAKGEQPFDAATVKTALETLATDAQKLDADKLFPEGTETGGDTEASPKIWEDRDGFKEQIAKYQADTAAAVKADPQDLESFQMAFKSITANCGACHQTYRVKK
ncbi:cytochrome c [Tianweitania sp. BSSL-BM11]|uniref:Cytochrome c n=1 Tax=Tianweitania aestuarii TaxID=2814886 RepID=A0ABS5RS30_9HYPH|nr:cytochrome c [Tianweitania aestuarii]MBS9719853.1 cytochrome c [Tianweitania aestuarii]